MTEKAATASSRLGGVRRPWPLVWVAACGGLCVALRATSWHWGLPFLFHPDEPTNFAVLRRMLTQHDLNPHFFNYPSLFFYLNALVQLAHYGVLRAFGLLHSLADLPACDVPVDGSGFTALPSAFVVARLLSTLAALLTVFVCHSIGRKLSRDVRVSLLAALLVAVSPAFLRDSRWLAPDGLATLLATATVCASLNVLERGRARDYLWASVLTGFAASLKYNAALVGITVSSAALLRDWRSALRRPWFYAAPFVAGLGFLVTTPYAVFDFTGFWRDFEHERSHYATGHAGAEGDTLRFYWDYLWSQEGAGAVFALGALVLGVIGKNAVVCVLASFVVVYFVFINLFVTRNGQTIVPIIPTLLCLAAWAYVECLRWLEVRFAARIGERARSPLVRSVSASALALVVAAYPFLGAVQRARALAHKDNRELAHAWVEQHAPEHSRIAIERYACYVDRRRYALKAALSLSSLDPAWLRNHEDYAIFAGDSFNRFIFDAERYPRQAARYRQFFRQFELLKNFNDAQRGAEVRIYRTRRAGSAD